MATNNFKPFAISSDANVLTQADYEILSALVSGFEAGKASSAAVNKAIRQATVMSYVLAQFISDSASVDVLDNGVPATILANLKSGLLSAAPGRLLNIQVLTASGTWTKTAGAKKGRMRAWGAGGGGANSGDTAPIAAASGCGGGYAEGIFDISAITSLPVVIGAGGANVAANTTANGGNGGATSVGTLISATGGGGGVSSGTSSGPGVGSNGNILNFTGQIGQGAVSSSLGGTGGASYSSFGGLGHSASAGDAGGYPGGGGAGGAKPSSTTYYASGKGANGLVIIEEYA